MNRIAVVAAILLTLPELVLAGCGSGQSASPNLDRTRIGLQSVDGSAGRLRLISVASASPGAPGSMHIAGDSAALLLTIANDGEAQDVLTGATTGAAKQVVYRTGDASPRPLQVAVPPGKVTVLREVTGPHLELSGLRETLRTGYSVPVTFHFRDAGSVTLKVPIRTYTDVPVDKVHEPSP